MACKNFGNFFIEQLSALCSLCGEKVSFGSAERRMRVHYRFIFLQT